MGVECSPVAGVGVVLSPDETAAVVRDTPECDGSVDSLMWMLSKSWAFKVKVAGSYYASNDLSLVLVVASVSEADDGRFVADERSVSDIRKFCKAHKIEPNIELVEETLWH